MACEQHSHIIKLQLWGKRLRATPARVELLEVFEHAKQPLSAVELEQKMGKHAVDKTTLYRNLDSLVKLQVLKAIHLNKKQQYYELITGFQRHHHHHLVCSKCGKVADVEGCDLKDYYKAMLKKTGFAEITDHSLEFFGICSKCTRPKFKPKL